MFKILAICGSTRAKSSNLNLIHAIIELNRGRFEFSIFKAIDQLPHFNPDLDHEHPPGEIIAFRNELQMHHGILICTPEYAMGVPGTLKNAIDWTVSSMEFTHKPTVLITASSVGEKGHRSLLETLNIIEAKITPATSLLIPFIKTKINSEAQITDPNTLSQIIELMNLFEKMLQES